MTTTNFLAALISKLVGIRVFVKNEVTNANQHPKAVMRGSLDGFLRVTQNELLEALGEKSPKKLTMKLRKSIAIVARIHRGCDSYKTIAEKAEVLIKRLSPIYKAELERVSAENARKAMRDSLEARFHLLSGGKALPAGIETPQLSDFVSDLRDELVAKTQNLMDEVNEASLRHPDVSRINDKNLLALASKLESRRAIIKPVRISMAPQLRAALMQ
jgi:hypothetical protein